MPRYVVPMSRGRAAAAMVLNTALFAVMCSGAVVVLAHSTRLGLPASGWAFMALWISVLIVIFVRNTMSCRRRYYLVRRLPWRGPPPGGHRLR